MGLIVVNKRSWYAADQRAGALRPNFEAADQLNALELCDETQLPSLCDKKNKKLTWRAADQCAGALRLNEAADQLNALELCVAQLRCDMARRRPTRWSFAAKCSRRPTKRAGALRCAITLCASTHRDMFHVRTKIHVPDRRPTRWSFASSSRTPANGVRAGALRVWLW